MTSSLLQTYSIEIAAKHAPELARVADRLPAGMPVAVACLPSESNTDRAHAVKTVRGLGFEPIPHISARLVASAAELQATLGQFTSDANVSRIFVIAGDLPAPRGPFPDALSVIRSGQLEEHGIREIGIAGYPQGHPKISDGDLVQALLEKQCEILQRGMRCTFTTQFSFDPSAALKWIANLRSSGLMSPVRVGVAGPATAATLMKYAALCGVRTSARVLAKYGLSITRLVGAGGPDVFIDSLQQDLRPWHGAVSLHVYPFGGMQKTADWMDKAALTATCGPPLKSTT